MTPGPPNTTAAPLHAKRQLGYFLQIARAIERAHGITGD